MRYQLPTGRSYQSTSQYRPNFRPCSLKWATRRKPKRSWSAIDASLGRPIPRTPDGRPRPPGRRTAPCTAPTPRPTNAGLMATLVSTLVSYAGRGRYTRCSRIVTDRRCRDERPMTAARMLLEPYPASLRAHRLDVERGMRGPDVVIVDLAHRGEVSLPRRANRSIERHPVILAPTSLRVVTPRLPSGEVDGDPLVVRVEDEVLTRSRPVEPVLRRRAPDHGPTDRSPSPPSAPRRSRSRRRRPRGAQPSRTDRRRSTSRQVRVEDHDRDLWPDGEARECCAPGDETQ